MQNTCCFVAQQVTKT